MMKNFFLLPFFWTLTFANLRFPTKNNNKLEAAFPSNLQDLESLKNLVRLVSDNNLNVSLVLSKIEDNADSSLEFSAAITFPLVKEVLTQTKLSKEDGKKFLNTARADKLAAKVFLSEEKNESSWENTIDKIPVTNVHEILTKFEIKRKGFRWQDKNCITQNTFFTTGAEGRNETVKVLVVDFDIQVLEFHNFTDEEIAVSKRLLTGAFITYTPKDFEQALVAMFRASYPSQKWQLVTDVGRNSYIKAKKMISLELDNTEYMIYSI